MQGQSSSGTEGASFLDIPVGGRPAAMAGAYSALASDAFAPVWNPAGLGFLSGTEFASTHLSYLDGLSYEYVSLVDRLTPDHSLGASVQYFHTGVLQGTDASGNATANFTSYYGAYSVAYGHPLNEEVSLGATGKLITARIDSATAQAWAMDLGGMYRPNEQWSVGAVLAQIGTKLTFISQGDSLPLGMRLGGAYQPNKNWVLSLEGHFPYSKGASPSAHLGVEWIPYDLIALRLGYKSDVSGLNPGVGFTTGLGMRLGGQEFDYAWVPFGDLGDTHYFSLVLRFGSSPLDEATRKAQKPDEGGGAGR